MSEYIERKAAVGKLMPIYKSASLRNRNVFSTARKCLEAVENIPAADVEEVRHGRWEDRREHDGEWYCAACGEEMTICSCGKDKTWEYAYCPNCGAKMDETLGALDETLQRVENTLDALGSVVRCRDCRHRDPEDHKCDCGGIQRQGCFFPVDDDYYCAYGERKGGDE